MSAMAAEDANEREARIQRMVAETSKFVAEHDKLAAEARKLARDHQLAPWAIVASTVAATTALLGAGAAFFKLVHG